MRKLFFLIALLFPISIFADNVTLDKAQTLAEKFLTKSSTKAGGNVRLVWDGESEATKASSEPAYYVFQSDGGGFVIISACDAVTPVLGYSYSGTFISDNMPQNLSDWMGRLRSEIIKVRDAGEKPSIKVQKEWDNLSTSGTIPVYSSTSKYYETALWDQNTPYNDLCPKDGDKNSVTGCVATSTAIVMKHRQWPEAGKGKLPDYSDVYGKRWELGHELGAYDWNNMLMEYKSGSYSEQQAKQVAQLMFDLGVMTKMIYSATSSGTMTQYAAPGLAKYMGYDNSIVYLDRHLFSEEEWLTKVKSEIDNVGPFVYSGQSGSGGHAFVVAGYDKSNYLYVNWGWSGKDNGYFSLTSMGGFTYSNGAVFNMFKDRGGEDPGISASYQGITVSKELIRKGESFNAVLTNVHGTQREGMVYISIGHHNAEGKLLEVVSQWYAIEGNFSSYYPTMDYNECKINLAISKGDYISPVYLTDAAAEEMDAIPLPFDDEIGGAASYCLDFPILSYTSFGYDKTSNLVTVEVSEFASPSLQLVTESGQTVSTGVTVSGKKMTIDKSVVSSGDYIIEIVVEGYKSSVAVKL